MIEKFTIEKYKCPTCGRLFDTEIEAEKCFNTVSEVHEYNVGDLILYTDCETDWTFINFSIIKELLFTNIEHKTGILYKLSNNKCVNSFRVEGFVKCKADIDKEKRYFISKLKSCNIPFQIADVEFDSSTGHYKIELFSE